MNIEQYFLIDIETVPQQPSFYQLDEQWQQLWMDKSAKYQFENAENKDTYQQRAGILAEFGKIICISAGWFEQDEQKRLRFHTHVFARHNETMVLQSFIAAAAQFFANRKNAAFAGHNIKEFDIPFICRRLMILQQPLPVFLQLHGQKPWENNMLDTLHWWRFGDYKNYTSLKLLAAVLGIPSSKDELDGSQVREYYYEKNDLESIARYCRADVEVVAQIILRFNNRPLLAESDFVRI
jgi:3'-5' exonuclease